MLLQNMSSISLIRHRLSGFSRFAAGACRPDAMCVYFFVGYGVRASSCPICQPHSCLISARGALAPSALLLRLSFLFLLRLLSSILFAAPRQHIKSIPLRFGCHLPYPMFPAAFQTPALTPSAVAEPAEATATVKSAGHSTLRLSTLTSFHSLHKLPSTFPHPFLTRSLSTFPHPCCFNKCQCLLRRHQAFITQPHSIIMYHPCLPCILPAPI